MGTRKRERERGRERGGRLERTSKKDRVTTIERERERERERRKISENE